MASQWIWPFELIEKIGEGGMGVVYRARYVGNDRIVAVKLLPTDIAENPTITARFDRELEILKQLKHPNIVHCFGGVCESKQRFYAMELIEGGTLAEMLRQKKRFSWDYVIEYGLQMCAGLQHAHERGIVHRDIKPGNFLITKAGQLKLSDFGLATMASASRITRAGKTAGTFLYMAPEQIRGQPPVTPRTDLYALGCVFYELLTGRPPFDGETPAMILQKHLKEPAPRVAPQMLDCPPVLDQLVADLLQKSPEQRPESAAEVESRLKSVLRPSVLAVDQFARTPYASMEALPEVKSPDSPFEVAVPPPPPRPVAPWIAALGVSILVGAWGWSQAYSQSRRLAEVERFLADAARQGEAPNRLWALDQLAQAPGLNHATAQTVGELLQDQSPAIRKGVLQVMQRQPRAAEGRLAEITRLKLKDDDPTVRQQATLTLEAVRDAPAERSGWGWFVFAVLGVSAVAFGWWAWSQRLWERWARA